MGLEFGKLMEMENSGLKETFKSNIITLLKIKSEMDGFENDLNIEVDSVTFWDKYVSVHYYLVKNNFEFDEILSYDYLDDFGYIIEDLARKDIAKQLLKECKRKIDINNDRLVRITESRLNQEFDEKERLLIEENEKRIERLHETRKKAIEDAAIEREKLKKINVRHWEHVAKYNQIIGDTETDLLIKN